ncbi:unnamed protein product, partial [Musa banksii]
GYGVEWVAAWDLLPLLSAAQSWRHGGRAVPPKQPFEGLERPTAPKPFQREAQHVMQHACCLGIDLNRPDLQTKKDV